MVYFYMGYCRENFEIGEILLNYGKMHANIRCLVLGYQHYTMAHSAAGNYPMAIESGMQAVNVSADPLYAVIPKTLIALSYLQMGEFKAAEKISNEILAFSTKFGIEYHGTVASAIQGMVMLVHGKMAKGFRQIEDALERWKKFERAGTFPRSEYILGKLYFQIGAGEGPIDKSILLKNAVFLIKTLPIARNRAESHFKRAVKKAGEMGIKGIAGQSYLDLGLLYQTKKKKKTAARYIEKAVLIFEQTNADYLLKQAKDALKSLNSN